MQKFKIGDRVVSAQGDKGTVVNLSNGDGYIIAFDFGQTLFCYNAEVRAVRA